MVAEITVPSSVPTRSQIEALEMELARHPQAVIPAMHYFADGIYGREITIPANTVLTGMVHKTQHINVVSKGEITVWTEQGMKRLKAPITFVSNPGTKRAGFTHEETVWTTFHANPTNEKEIPVLEGILAEPLRAEFIELLNTTKGANLK